MRKHHIAATVALSVLVLGACSTGDANGDGAKIVETTTPPQGEEKIGTTPPAATQEPTTQEPEPEVEGTRSNPLTPGTTFTLSDYTLTVGTTTASPQDTQALAQAEADAYYDGDLSWVTMPEEGNVVAWAPISGTYDGDQSGDPAMDLSWAYVGSSGKVHEFSTAYLVPLDDIWDVGEMYGGAPFEASISQEVPLTDVEGGVWRLGAAFAMDAEYVFIASER